MNNFEIVIFLLFFKLFVIFFLNYVNVIFKKRVPLIKVAFTAFVHFKLHCKMSGVILNGAKKAFERGVIKKYAMIVSYEQTGIFSSDFRHSEDYFLKIKRLLSEYQLL